MPLTRRACGALDLWLSRFPEAGSTAFVFPAHMVSQTAGTAPKLRGVDFTKSVTSWKTAWRRALRESGLQFRWHDLRHTFVTRLAESPAVSDEVLRQLAGHVSQEMLRRYSHVRNAAKKQAIAVLEEATAQPTAQNPSQNPDEEPGELNTGTVSPRIH